LHAGGRTEKNVVGAARFAQRDLYVAGGTIAVEIQAAGGEVDKRAELEMGAHQGGRHPALLQGDCQGRPSGRLPARGEIVGAYAGKIDGRVRGKGARDGMVAIDVNLAAIGRDRALECNGAGLRPRARGPGGKNNAGSEMDNADE